MKITSVSIHRDSGKSTITSPSWEAIECAIRSLDGDDCIEVALRSGDEVVMDIHGGYKNYLCQVLDEQESWWMLVHTERSKEELGYIIKYEQPVYGLYCLVGLDDVIQAAKYLFVNGKLKDPSFAWEPT